MKKLLLILAGLLVMFAFTACPGNGDDPVDETVTITYNANGWEGAGVPTSIRTVIKGEAIGAQAIPTLTNTATQRFDGWALTPTGTPITVSYAPTTDITLYVRWTNIDDGG